jgi:putative transposase
MIRDLILQSVEQRFGSCSLPDPVQWLCYGAHETIDFAYRPRLVTCFTPVRCPQSNGMAEAFLKPFKRAVRSDGAVPPSGCHAQSCR